MESHFKRLYETSVLDSLNKTYVACTRAVSELIITIRKGDSADLGQLTEKYIFTMNGINADEWEAGKKTQAVNPKSAEEVVEMPDYEANPMASIAVMQCRKHSLTLTEALAKKG